MADNQADGSDFHRVEMMESAGASSNFDAAFGDVSTVSKISLMMLNDDCLLEIFRMLSPANLLSIAYTCTRFRTVAQRAFALDHQAIEPNRWFYKTLEITNFFETFGSIIIDLKCLSTGPYENVLSLIIENCSGTLRSLDLEHFSMKAMSTELLTLFENLETLILRKCSLDLSPEVDLISKCHKLTTLKLYYVECPFENIPSQLECLSLIRTALPNRATQMASILRDQKKLKKLVLYMDCSLADYRGPNINDSAIANLCADNLIDLRINKLTIVDSMVPKLRALFGKLQTLVLQECTFNTKPGESLFSKCKNTLRELTIDETTRFFDMTGKDDFSELTFFKLNHVYRMENEELTRKYLEFFKNIKNVKELHIDICKFDVPWICENIVDHMHKLEKLRINSNQEHYTGFDNILYEHNVLPLSKMEHIKKLTLVSGVLHMNGELTVTDMPKIINSMVSIECIEYLYLRNFIVDDRMIKAISKLKSLRQLKLVNEENNDYNYCTRRFGLKPFENLSQLFYLKLKCEWFIDHAELADVVVKLTKLKSLILLTESERYSRKDIAEINEIRRNNPDLAILTEENDGTQQHTFN